MEKQAGETAGLGAAIVTRLTGNNPIAYLSAGARAIATDSR
jgi:hypothetical protein